MKITILTALGLSAVVSAAPAPGDPHAFYNDPRKFFTPPPSTDDNRVACMLGKEHMEDWFNLETRYTIATEGPWTHPNETFLRNEIQHSCKIKKWKWAYGSRGEGEGVFKMSSFTPTKCIEKAIEKAILLKGLNGTTPAVKCFQGEKIDPLFRELWWAEGPPMRKRGLKSTGNEVEVAKAKVAVSKEETKKQRSWKRISVPCIVWFTHRTCHKHKEPARDP